MIQTFQKDPSAVLDWYFDWKMLSNGTGDSDWLASGEIITEAAVTVTGPDSGLTADELALVNGSTAVQVWLGGGSLNAVYAVTCAVTTDAGRKDERSCRIEVVQR